MTALVPYLAPSTPPAIARAYAARGYPDLLLEMHRARLERQARMWRVEAIAALPAPAPPIAAAAPRVSSLSRLAWGALYYDAHAIIDWLEARSTPQTAMPRSALIKAEVCREFGVARQEMMSAARTMRVARARQVAMWLHHELRPQDSLPTIGRSFARPVGPDGAITPVDHTTVLHAVRKVAARIAADLALAARVAWLTALIVAKALRAGGVP